MSKKTKLTPELRFPEFVDEGEWEEKKLGKIAKYENGKAHEQNIVKQGNYIAVNSKFISTDGKVKKYTNTANCLASKGEILMVLSDLPNGKALAKCFYVDINNNYSVNQRICKITPINAENKILYYLLNRNSYFLSFDDGVKQTNLRIEDVLKCPIILPKIQKEQQKIASCLSSLDEVIAAQGQKLDLLKDHKKGLMQKLFPQEGEKVPKYRFKEFEKDGEWVERTLQSVSEVIMGSSPSSSSYNEKKIGLPLLQGNADIKNRLSTPRIYTSVVTKECEVGDILLSVRAPVGTVAKSLHKACIGRGISALRAIKPNSQEYLYQLLFSYESSWKNISQGGTFDAVNSNDIRNLILLIPKPKEQQKIASCLSSLDTLITAQTEKIEQLKLHKKGLMQGLFPKMND